MVLLGISAGIYHSSSEHCSAVWRKALSMSPPICILRHRAFVGSISQRPMMTVYIAYTKGPIGHYPASYTKLLKVKRANIFDYERSDFSIYSHEFV